MRFEWCEEAGQIVEAIGTPRFPASLSQGLRRIVDFDYTVIFGYVGSARPLDLYDDFPPDRRLLHVEEYQEGPYLLDPFFLASMDLSEPGLWRLGEIAPDRFYQGEYWRNYYAQTGLAEEVGYLIDINKNLVIVVSLMRKEKRFSNVEIRALKAVWPIVNAAARQNWHDIALDESESASAIEERIEQAFYSIGKGVLTPRERYAARSLCGRHRKDTGHILRNGADSPSQYLFETSNQLAG